MDGGGRRRRRRRRKRGREDVEKVTLAATPGGHSSVDIPRRETDLAGESIHGLEDGWRGRYEAGDGETRRKQRITHTERKPSTICTVS